MTHGVALEDPTESRFMPSGDEAGTPTGDRKFRPDVQGLRAVAILLVVLFHADLPRVTGGYVGVDVFFVVSGFVITGLLLRERDAARRTSILSFYARRARRIIPAASVVIVVTVVASFIFIGSVTGRNTAIDGQWASLFLANFHFSASQTNYLASLRPPSPLQNFWSLAVEEQYYLVYPTVFLLVAGVLVRRSLRIRIGLVLGATVVASYAVSIWMTSSDPAAAYFSPATRAWELALGGLVAVSSDALRRVPQAVAAALTWIGLGAIVVAAFVFTSATPYPGSAVALPVVGAALIIAGGTAEPAWGAEALLRRRPFQLLGLISYSLYLWHWPILIIAAESRGSSLLPVGDNVWLVALSVVIAIASYRLIENPVRHSSVLVSRSGRSVIVGVCLIAASLGACTVAVAATKPPATVGIANAAEGSNCPNPSRHDVAALRATYLTRDEPSPAVHGARPLRMLVVGDSTACTMLGGLAAVAPTYNVQVVNGTVIGCGVVSDTLAPYELDNRNWVAYTSKCERRVKRIETYALESGKPDIVLWGSTDEGSSIVNPPSGTQVLHSGSSRWKTVMLQRIDARVRSFTANGAKVILLLEPAEVHGNEQSSQQMNALLRQVATQFPTDVGTVDLASVVCPSGPPCPSLVHGITLRPDNLHYGPAGSVYVARHVMPAIMAKAQSLR